MLGVEVFRDGKKGEGSNKLVANSEKNMEPMEEGILNVQGETENLKQDTESSQECAKYDEILGAEEPEQKEVEHAQTEISNSKVMQASECTDPLSKIEKTGNAAVACPDEERPKVESKQVINVD